MPKKSGAFDKPDIITGFGNFRMPKNLDSIQIFYGAEYEKSSLNITDLPFQITNIGQKNVEDIKLILEFPSLVPLVIKDTNIVKKDLVMYEDYKRTITSDEKFDIITHQLKTLNPNVCITYDEPIFFFSTELRDTIRIDSQRTYKYNTVLGLNIKANLLAKDLPTITQIFTLHCLTAKTIDELILTQIKEIKRLNNKNYSAFFVLPKKGFTYSAKKRRLHIMMFVKIVYFFYLFKKSLKVVKLFWLYIIWIIN